MATTPMTITKPIDSAGLNLKEHVVSINRVTKVVKGGKNLSFSALVVVGDADARVVGYATGKAKEVPAAIKKAIEAAKKNLRRINVKAGTIAHVVVGVYGGGRVLLKPAPEGTGVIAGGPVRAVIEAVGNLRHPRRDHAEDIGLDLEIDVVCVDVVARIAGEWRQDTLADIREARIIGMPHLADARVPLVRHGDGGNVDAIPSQAIQKEQVDIDIVVVGRCLLYTSPSPRDYAASRMPSSA